MRLFKGIQGFLDRNEPVFFYLILILNLIPILSVKFFPTVDGPAHLYNAKLILELISGSSSWQDQISINDSFTPNWTGHLLLALLIKLFSPSVAEKIILGVYLVGVPVFVRQLLLQLKAPGRSLAYLVFPFLYSYLFHYGFFNYHLAIVFFFAALSAWLRALKSASTNQWILAGVLAAVTALGHPFVFGLFAIVTLVLTASKLIDSNSSLRQLSIGPFLALAPGVAVTTYFLLSSESITQLTSRIPWGDLLVSFKYIMPIKGLNAEMYHLPSKVLLYLLSGLSVLALGWLVFPSVRSRSTFFTWLAVSGLTGLLVFLMPDYLGDAGLISSRLMWFFFIFLIITLALVDFPRIIRSISLVGALFLTGWSINHNYNQIKSASDLANEVVEVSQSIEPGSTLLAVVQNCNPQFIRVGHYAGLQNDILLLRNYEAELSYFPLIWNYDQLPKFRLGEMGPSNCVGWVEGGLLASKQIDYLMLVSEPSCNKDLECKQLLVQNYSVAKELANGRIKLFGRKRP
jgi:hypothetical protein